MNKKALIIGVTLSVSAISLGVVGFVALNNKKDFNYLAATDVPNQLVFSTETTTAQTIVVDSKNVDYAYATTNKGNKYAIVQQNRTIDHIGDDLFAYKGNTNNFFIAYGDVASDGTYTPAEFKSGVKSVTVDAKYTFSFDQTFYLRIYYSNDPSVPETNDNYKSRKVTRDEYSTLTYDLESLGLDSYHYIKFRCTNGNVSVYISNITINFGC